MTLSALCLGDGHRTPSPTSCHRTSTVAAILLPILIFCASSALTTAPIRGCQEPSLKGKNCKQDREDNLKALTGCLWQQPSRKCYVCLGKGQNQLTPSWELHLVTHTHTHTRATHRSWGQAGRWLGVCRRLGRGLGGAVKKEELSLEKG